MQQPPMQTAGVIQQEESMDKKPAMIESEVINEGDPLMQFGGQWQPVQAYQYVQADIVQRPISKEERDSIVLGEK